LEACILTIDSIIEPIPDDVNPLTHADIEIRHVPGRLHWGSVHVAHIHKLRPSIPTQRRG
jgi:hypothetical protein